MKVGKMIEELQKCDLDAVIKMHRVDGDELKMLHSFLGCIALQTGKEDDADPLRAEYTEERFIVYSLLEALYAYADHVDVVTHSLRDGKPVLFVEANEDVPGIVVLKDGTDS